MWFDVIVIVTLLGLVAAISALIVTVARLWKSRQQASESTSLLTKRSSASIARRWSIEDWRDEQSPITLVADLRDLGIVVLEADHLHVSPATATMLVAEVFETTTDGFVALQYQDGILQFIPCGRRDTVVVERPSVGGCHQLVLTRTSDITAIVDAFFQQEDLAAWYEWDWIPW